MCTSPRETLDLVGPVAVLPHHRAGFQRPPVSGPRIAGLHGRRAFLFSVTWDWWPLVTEVTLCYLALALQVMQRQSAHRLGTLLNSSGRGQNDKMAL